MVRAASEMSARSSASASPQPEWLTAPCLRRNHVVDQRAAMENALLLARHPRSVPRQYFGRRRGLNAWLDFVPRWTRRAVVNVLDHLARFRQQLFCELPRWHNVFMNDLGSFFKDPARVRHK